MGDIGTPSRLLAGRFGAPFTFATFHHERTLAPGQLSFTQMTEIYHYDRMRPTTAVYGVIGDPISHSLSPHGSQCGAWRTPGIDGVYIPFRVPREHLGQFLDDAPALGVTRLERHDSAQGAGRQAADQVRRHDRRRRRGQHAGLSSRQGSKASTPIIRRPSTAWKPPTTRRPIARFRSERKSGPGAGSRRSGQGDRLWAETPRGDRDDCRPHCPAGRSRWPPGSIANWSTGRARYSVNPDVLINCTPVGMHPNVDATPYRKASSAAVDAGLRHGLQSGEHAVDQGRPQPELHGGDRAWRCSSARPACNSNCSPARKLPAT